MIRARIALAAGAAATLALTATPAFAPYFAQTPEGLVGCAEVAALFEVTRGNLTPETIFEAPQGSHDDFDFHIRPAATMNVITPLKGCAEGDVFEVPTLKDWPRGGPPRERAVPPIFLSDGQQALVFLGKARGQVTTLHIILVRDGKLEIEYEERKMEANGELWGAGSENLPVDQALQVVADAVKRWHDGQNYHPTERTSAQAIDDYGDNTWINYKVIEELSKRQDAAALGALLDKADDFAKVSIARELGKVPGEAPVPFLVQLLKSPYAGISCEALEGLARPEAKAAVPALLAALEREPAGGRRPSVAGVARAMAAIRDPQGVEAVLRVAEEPEVSDVAEVIDALAPLLPDPKVKAFMLARLRDPQVWVNPDAFRGEGQDAIERQRQRYRYPIMLAAAEALTKSGSDAGFERLMELFEERPWEDERSGVISFFTVIDAIGEAGDKRAAPALLRLMEEPPPHRGDFSKASIALALVRLRDERVIEPLRAVLRSTVWDTRARLLDSLATWDSRAVNAMLMTEFNGKHWQSVCAVAMILHKRGDPRGANRLLNLLTGGLAGWSTAERYHFYTALGEMKDWRAVPVLIAAMATQEEDSYHIGQALSAITDYYPHDDEDPAVWQKWWREGRE